jgi:hypothetical protein
MRAANELRSAMLVGLFRVLDGFRDWLMSYAFARSAMESKYQADYARIDWDSMGKDMEQERAAETNHQRPANTD